MKAQEYAERLNAISDDTEFVAELGVVCTELYHKVGDLLQSRNAKSVSSAAACFREVETKWKAIMGRVVRFKNSRAFDDLLWKVTVKSNPEMAMLVNQELREMGRPLRVMQVAESFDE